MAGPFDWLGNFVGGIGSTLGNIGNSFTSGLQSGFGGMNGQSPLDFSQFGDAFTKEDFGALSGPQKANYIASMSQGQNWNQNNPMQWINTMGNLGLGLAQYNRAGDIFDFKKDAWKADQNAARKTYNTNRGDKLASRWSFAGGEDRNYNDQYDKDKLDYV